MATQLQELQAKRKELQATNPNASMLDARNALTPAISNAPVAGQPPATPPVTPSNKEVLAQNQARVQSEIQAGTRPEAGFVGNAVQELGGDVANRQNTRNVMTGQGGTRTPNGAILNADGTVTQTPESLASNAGSTIVGNQYDQRTPEQKAVGATATPEQAAKSTGGVIGGTPTTPTATTPETPKTTTQTTPPVPTDKNGIFNALVTGQAVTPTNTPEYRKAKASYDTFQKFNGMSKQQFIDSIKQGQITTELNSQLASNPVFQEAKAEIDKINRANGINTMITNISQGLSGNAIPTPDYFETISANLIKKYGLTTNESQNAFKQIVSQDEDVVKATKELSEINRQVAETTKLINDGYKEIRQKYQGKLSATQLISYMDNRFRSATDTLNALNTQRQYVEADLKTATDMAINEYNAFQKDLADRNALRNTLIQSELGLATKSAEMQMEADFAKRQAYENLNDPATAIANVMAEYKKLGIPFTTTIQSRLQEFANSGLSLPDYLTQMTESIQASPAYQQYAQMKAGELSDVQKMQLQAQISEKADIRNFAQQIQLAQMQGDITRANYLWQIQNDPEKQAKLLELQQKANENKSLYDMLGINVGTYEGNRGYDLAGKKGDPVPAGGNWKVKSVIDANYTSSPYGNSVVMEDENGNTVRYSHLESIGVKPGDTLGFGEIVGTRGNTGNVRGKNGEVLTAEQIKAGRGSHVDVEIKDKSGRLLSQAEQVDYLKSKKPAMQFGANAISIANGVGDLSDLTPTDKKTILPQLEQIINSRMTGDSGRDSVVKSALYKKDVSDSTLQKMTDMQTVAFQLDSIQERLANQKIGPILGQIKKLNPYDTEAQVALAELAGITPKVARGIFGEVGVLTDTDIENYQKTLPNLTSTEEKNVFVVEVMKKLLAKGVINTIETQARGQRNMSPFLDVYDKAKSSLNTSSTSKYE